MEKTELVFIPTPAMGHMLSLVELAKLIVGRHPDNISIIVLIFKLPVDSPTVNAYVESQSRDSHLLSGLTFITLPPISNPPDPSTPDFFSTFLTLNKPLVKQVLEDRVRSGSPKPGGFVLDMFCSSFSDVADELNIPTYFYFTSGANLLNLFFYFQSLADDTLVNIIEFKNSDDFELDIPGFKSRVPCKVIPRVFFDMEGGNKMVLNIARALRKCNGILVNTFMEMESYTIQTLLDQHHDGKIPAIYPVGPIMELERKSTDGVSKSENEDEECIIQWLDEQPESSVVFLCFGSMGSFDAPQVQEIASGLERAGHRFLWSLRRPPPEDKKYAMHIMNEIFEDAIPEGFLDRTGKRGKIIGWAPQVSVLAHRAVGGFVSHCGWNSTLESTWFGVPMATWPLSAEQQLNAFKLVKELGIGVEIRMDYQRDWKTGKGNMLVRSDEIESGVKKLMSMDKEMKEKVREMSEQGKKALDENGSSYHWLNCFIAHVLGNSTAKYSV